VFLFDKIKDPIFLKEDSVSEQYLLHLKEQLKTSFKGQKEKLEEKIRLIEAGIFGEKNIAFELKNSHIPMVVLHDIYLEFNGLSAQIDYLIITRKKKIYH
jgi:hypothetical protein